MQKDINPNENDDGDVKNKVPLDDIVQDDNTSIGEVEEDNNSTNNHEHDPVNENGTIPPDSPINREENDDSLENYDNDFDLIEKVDNSLEDIKENLELPNNDQGIIDNLKNGLKERIEGEIIHPIQDLLHVVKERETKLAEQLLGVQWEEMKFKRKVNHEKMMKELKIELMKTSNHFMIHQITLEQRRNIVNLLM